jgi:hypothetical protein
MTPEEKHNQCVMVSRMIREITHKQFGIWMSDEELDMNIRFAELVIKHRKDKCFEEWLTHQLYAYLSYERKLQIVSELEDYSNRKSK